MNFKEFWTSSNYLYTVTAKVLHDFGCSTIYNTQIDM